MLWNMVNLMKQKKKMTELKRGIESLTIIEILMQHFQ